MIFFSFFRRAKQNDSHFIMNSSFLLLTVELRLDRNKLTGGIDSLQSLQNLEILHLQENQLSSTIPDMFDKLFRLHEFIIHSNKFTGIIPKTLTHLQGLSKSFETLVDFAYSS
jgi:Leucine-rich repeat (LRR) protein